MRFTKILFFLFKCETTNVQTDIKHFTKDQSEMAEKHLVMFKNLHMSGFVGYNEGRRETVFMIEGAAADRVAHPSDGGIS